MPDTQTIAEWKGQDLLDADGDKIGTIDEIYIDSRTEQPEWALVKTGLFGGKGTFVPLSQASPQAGGVGVPAAGCACRTRSRTSRTRRTSSPTASCRRPRSARCTSTTRSPTATRVRAAR